MSRQSKTRAGASRKPASRTNKKSSANVPAWVWIFTGIITGLFIAFLMKLTPNPVDVNALQAPEPESSEPPEEHKAVFDFYTLLPESEVLIPEITEPSKPAGSPTASTSKPAASPSVYLLQAGSFRSSNDADRLRAQLTLEGLDVKTQKVTIRGNETWYRVQVGPFSNTSQLDQARQTLAKHSINPLPLKLK